MALPVHLEQMRVPGILNNEPKLPRTATDGSFAGLLPGTYRVVVFLPDDVFSSDPHTALVEGRWATVKTITVTQCQTENLTIDVFRSSRGKITGGMKEAVPGGFSTAGFVLMTKPSGPFGNLGCNDHTTGLQLHTKQIDGIWVNDAHTEGWVWGKVKMDGQLQRFRLRLIDLGEPGRSDVFALQLAGGYGSGVGELIMHGNVQIHKK